ncbi:MAG: hypothetical protein NZ604_04800 [Flavobacteriales bacterium]|nr:hypothetical protein [Flavobacteriales bacterium]
MHDRVTNVIALAKHRDLLHKRELICRFIRMNYHVNITPIEIGYRVEFLKDVCMYDEL